MRCPSCSSSAVLHDQLLGEYICTRCGLVIVERLIVSGPEWREKPGGEHGRADLTSGVDITLHDFGLGSKFGLSDDLPPSWRARLRRMQLWQRRSRASSWVERSLREALIELDKFCENLDLPKGVKAEISSLYRKVRGRGFTAGRGTHQVLAALIFITCRLRNLPRTEGEVVRSLMDLSGSGAREAERNLRQLTKFFSGELRIKLPRPSADDYINRFAPQLGLPVDVIECAHELNNSLPRRFRQARSPLLLAAIVLYLAAEMKGKRVPLKRVAGALGVGVSSISKNLAKARELRIGVKS